MKLTYWVAVCKNDSTAYNIRTRSRRECLQQRREFGEEDYGPATKVTVEYRDGFDLMLQCLSEGSAYWEPVE